MQARQSKHCIDKSTSRERERCVCVCIRFEFRQFVFFTLGTRLRISKFCVDLCKKSDRTRCLAVLILEYNLGPKNYWVQATILTGIRSRQSELKRFGFLKEERISMHLQRSRLGEYRTRWTFY